MSKSAIARGASMAASVWYKLDKQVKAMGGTDDAIHNLDKQVGESLLNTIAELLVKAELKTRSCFPITVDYAKSLGDMILSGNYVEVNPNISAVNFPLGFSQIIVDTEIILVSFDHNISSDDVVEELAKLGLEPAKLEHAAAFGAKYPLAQCEHPIAFLGSIWTDDNGDRQVPCLGNWGSERMLDLSGWTNMWPREYRFAAVRKSLANAL